MVMGKNAETDKFAFVYVSVVHASAEPDPIIWINPSTEKESRYSKLSFQYARDLFIIV